MDYKECDINKDGGRKEKKKKRRVSVINKHSSTVCVRLHTSKSPFNLACNMYREILVLLYTMQHLIGELYNKMLSNKFQSYYENTYLVSPSFNVVSEAPDSSSASKAAFCRPSCPGVMSKTESL